MTELDFLLELLLEHELADKTKKAVRSRIKRVQVAQSPQPAAHHKQQVVVNGSAQAPSMVAKIAAMEMEKKGEVPAPTPIVATTVAAAQALASRQQAINMALSGKVDKPQTNGNALTTITGSRKF